MCGSCYLFELHCPTSSVLMGLILMPSFAKQETGKIIQSVAAEFRAMTEIPADLIEYSDSL